MAPAEGGRRPHDKFEPLDSTEWQPLTPEQRIAYASEIAEAEARGFQHGAMWAKAQCLQDHATVARRIDAAARAFYLLEADDFHRGVGE